MRKFLVSIVISIFFTNSYEPHAAIKRALESDNDECQQCADILERLNNPQGFIQRRGSDLVTLAAQRGKEGCLALFLGYKAYVNHFDHNGYTPLMYTACHGFDRCARLLLEHGAIIDLTNSRGETALHHAANWEHVAVAKVLMSFNADPLVPNKNGDTPLTIAESGFNKSVFYYLDSEIKKRLFKKQKMTLKAQTANYFLEKIFNHDYIQTARCIAQACVKNDDIAYLNGIDKDAFNSEYLVGSDELEYRAVNFLLDFTRNSND